MLNYLGQYYGAQAWNAHGMHLFGWTGEQFGLHLSSLIGIVVGLLLLSAVNTAVGAMIGLGYMLARDGEMPKSFTRLNSHGVPWAPLCIAVALPFVLTIFTADLDSLADMYAIGVVGAISVNLGSCWYNKKLGLVWWERLIMGVTFVVLMAVELSIARTKPAALFFAVCVLGIGFALRAYSMKRAGLQTITLTKELAAAVSPELWANLRIDLNGEQSIWWRPVVLRRCCDLRWRRRSSAVAALYVLYVKELAVNLPARMESLERPHWQEDRRAAEIMYGMLEMGRENGVKVMPVYSVSDNPSMAIIDLACTLGVDLLLLGASQRQTLASLLKGDIVGQVASNLPDNIQLVIHG